MEEIKWLLNRYGKWIVIIVVVIISSLILEHKSDKEKEKKVSGTVSQTKQEVEINEKTLYEKGYDLPVDEAEDLKARQEGLSMMQKIQEIYRKSDKGNAINVSLSDKTVREMVDLLDKESIPVLYDNGYDAMCNYQEVDQFLQNALEGKKGEIIIYEVHNSGGIGRNKFIFDGIDMYVLYTGFSWTDDNKPIVFDSTFTKIKTWKYTNKGWFCYEYCVPEPPEVTEIVDGHCMMRVRPLNEKYRELSERYLFPLGYKGNNLLCSDWNEKHMEDIDYNGLFEYLYMVQYQERIDVNKYTNGIPKNEFEELMTAYLPVTIEQLQQYAVFDEKSQTYVWNQLGCMNYAPNAFGLSMPEIIGVQENKDGTITLSVDAICERLSSDCVIRHELVVQLKDEKIKYLSNRVLEEGLKNIPEYQYRLK